MIRLENLVSGRNILIEHIFSDFSVTFEHFKIGILTFYIYVLYYFMGFHFTISFFQFLYLEFT